jgi:tRNA (guanosine-2'-O-)-methyltransferase
MKSFGTYAFRRQLPSPIGPHELDHLISEARRERYRQVLARRTTRICVVVDNCYDAHNASAVIRTCDAFGVHRVRVITTRNSFKVNRQVAQGAHLHVDLGVYRGVEALYADLRAAGYRIMVTDLAADAVVDPHDLALPVAGGQAVAGAQSVALVFGNEEGGTSPDAISRADGRFLIPMCGFTQSLNLSVSVAVTLFSLRHRALAADAPGDMADDEQRLWYDRWVRLRIRDRDYDAQRPPIDRRRNGDLESYQ